MVGTDCGVGKKYSALALHRELERRDIKTSFRATGQTGIMIAGEGIPIDSVVADFISGAAEVLSPDNDDDHCSPGWSKIFANFLSAIVL